MERRRNFALQYGIEKLEYTTINNSFVVRVICGSCGQIFGRKVWNSTDDRFRRIICAATANIRRRAKRVVKAGILTMGFVLDLC